MIKNARLTALLSSFVISFNTLSGGVNEIKVFAEEEVLPNIKDALESIDVNNDSDNEINKPVEPSVPNNPEVDDSEPSVPDTPEVEDSIPSTPLEPSIPTVPSTPLEPSTPIQPSASLVDSSVSTIKDNIYYTKDDKISFTFNINNVSNIKISSKEQSNFKYTIGNYDKFIKGNVTVDFYSLKPHDVNDVTITFKNGKTSKDINISFIYDNESPKISFNKTEDVPFGDDINKEDGVYYFYCENQNSFDEKFTIYVKANDNIDIKHTTFEVDANINKQDLGNGLYKLTISNIKENKVNTLKVSSTDFAGNTTEREFKFFKDTARAQVKLDLSSNKNIQVYKNKYYINKDVEELSLDLQLNHVENAKDFSIENNIKIDDKIVAEYDPDSDSEDLSAELIKVNNNKYKLVLRNIDGNKNYKLEFVNLKDNNSDKKESSVFNMIKDITAPTLTLAEENKGISYKDEDSNTLHVKYDDKSPELSFSSENEDVKFSFEYEDDNNIIDQSKTKDKTESSVIENIVFSKDGSAKITVTATDYSGNETSETYTIVMDSTDYSEGNKTFNDYINATVAGKSFKNNILYLYNNTTAEHAIKFEYKDNLNDKFIMYDSKDEKISDSQDIILEYLIDGNDYTYKLISKNGSFDASNTYKIYYTNKHGFSVQFTYDGNKAIPKIGGLYSSSDENTFNFKAKVIDSYIVEVKEVRATIEYTKPNGHVKTKSITVPTNSKYIKTDKEYVPIGKDSQEVNTYTLNENLLKNLLSTVKLDKFEDGNYTITIEVVSEFEYDKADDKVFSVNFNIDSSAPEATLVLKDNNPKVTLLSKILKNNNYVIPNNEDDLYINTTELLVGIKKSDLESSDLFKTRRKVTIHNKEIDFSHLTPINEDFGGYKLFSIDFEKAKISKDDFIGVDHTYKKYDFEVKVKDTVDNGENSTSKDIKYTVDNTRPQFEIYADSKVEGMGRSYLSKSNEPYVDAKNIMVNLTNESNNTLDTFNQKNNNVFLWFDKKVKSQVKSNDNMPSYNVKELLKINDEGLYEITVSAKDKAGNRSESTFYINIDTKSPEINMGFASQTNAVAELKSTIIETIEYGSTSTTNNITVEDTMNSADEVTLKLDEINFGFSKPFGDNAAQVGNSMSLDTSSVADGIYNATLTVKDKAGHVSTEYGKITIDGKKPVLSIDANELQATPFGEDEYTIEHKNLNSVNPVITITDITTKPEDITINLNARDTKNSKKITVNENNSSLNKYTRTITLPSISQQDVYSLDVITKDELGRKTTSKINFGIDREAPSLSVTAGGKSITEGSMTYLNKQDAKDLVATVNDNILSPNEIKTVITLNGVSKSGTEYTFTEDNTYDINITTSDKAGNSTSMNFTIIVDTVIPAVDIENIIEGTYYNKDVLPKIITDDETAVETITLNGKPYTKETTITADNSYTLIAKAEDPAGNIGEDTVNFVIDKTSPVIKITNIEENGFYDEGELIPEIIVTDNDVNVETVMFLDNKSYFAGENVSTDGSHVLYVKAVDSASNTTEATVKFKTNFNPPVIKINDIEDGQVFYGPVTLDIEFEDTEKSYIYVNGKEHMNGDVLSKPGKYKLKVSAIDEFESESEETLNFTISENVVIPSTNEKSEFTANTYKLIATSIVAIASIALIGGFFIIKRKKDENANE